jgi:WD40 repeat protein
VLKHLFTFECDFT